MNTERYPSRQHVNHDIITTFKTTPCQDTHCPVLYGGLYDSCPLFHCEADKRRVPFASAGQLLYSDILCGFKLKGDVCQMGDLCIYSHNQFEVIYHPKQARSCSKDNYRSPKSYYSDTQQNSQYYSQESFKEQPRYKYDSPTLIKQVSDTRFDTQEKQSIYNISHEKQQTKRGGKKAGRSTRNVTQHKKLDPLTFKTEKCGQSSSHNHKRCIYFHSCKDKRRYGDKFSSDLCKYSETEQCPKGSKCKLSHNRVERLYHQTKYKTKFCTYFPKNMKHCEYGEFCSFAHSVEDIKVRLIHTLELDVDFYLFHFKTEWCPFTRDHNKAQCVYAHNWQDFRRNPYLFKYAGEMCPNWRSGTFISEYYEGCKKQELCQFSHGWKEKEFHPHNYQVYRCEEKKCVKRYDCSGYHTTQERRYPSDSEAPVSRDLFTPSQSLNFMNINTEREFQYLKNERIRTQSMKVLPHPKEINNMELDPSSKAFVKSPNLKPIPNLVQQSPQGSPFTSEMKRAMFNQYRKNTYEPPPLESVQYPIVRSVTSDDKEILSLINQSEVLTKASSTHQVDDVYSPSQNINSPFQPAQTDIIWESGLEEQRNYDSCPKYQELLLFLFEIGRSDLLEQAKEFINMPELVESDLDELFLDNTNQEQLFKILKTDRWQAQSFNILKMMEDLDLPEEEGVIGHSKLLKFICSNQS